MREIPITATQRRRMESALQGEYDTVAECADAVLALAWELYDERSKYAVIAQLDGQHPILAGIFPSFSTAHGFGSNLAVSAIDQREAKWQILPVVAETSAAAIRKATATTQVDRDKQAAKLLAKRQAILDTENERLRSIGKGPLSAHE